MIQRMAASAVFAGFAAGLLALGLRREERLLFRPGGAHGRVMFQQRFVNFRQTLEDGRVGHQVLAHLQEGAVPDVFVGRFPEMHP